MSKADYITLITSMFIHVDKYHLLFNMIFFWTFGALLETLVGWKKFIAYYLGAGIAGGVLHGIFISVIRPELGDIPAIGASAAIYGIMGIFVVRCYFAKVKVAISLFLPLLFIPRRFKMSPLILIGFYFLLNFYYGVKYISMFTPVGYWAHTGGFLFGITVSLLSSHLRSANEDNYRGRSAHYIEKRIGLGQARQDLRALLVTQPHDADALRELARLESMYRLTAEAGRLYQRAIQYYWINKKREQAAETFKEYFQKYRDCISPSLQFQLCRELANLGEYEIASRALEAGIKQMKNSDSKCGPEMTAKYYIFLGRILADKMNLPEPAIRVFAEFLKLFPQAEQKEMVVQKMRLLLSRRGPGFGGGGRWPAKAYP